LKLEELNQVLQRGVIVKMRSYKSYSNTSRRNDVRVCSSGNYELNKILFTTRNVLKVPKRFSRGLFSEIGFLPIESPDPLKDIYNFNRIGRSV